jgi:hypothetical protein
MDALTLVVARTRSMAVRHRAAGACVALRAASRSGVESGLGACLRAGQAAVGDAIRAFIDGTIAATELPARCVDEAIGSVVVHQIRALDIAHWGSSFGHFGHVCTLIVAGAVNTDEWRARLIARGRERDRTLVYHKVIFAVEELAARIGLEQQRRRSDGGADSDPSAIA